VDYQRHASLFMCNKDIVDKLAVFHRVQSIGYTVIMKLQVNKNSKFVAITESRVTCGSQTWYSSGDLEKIPPADRYSRGVLLITTNRNCLCYYAGRLTVLNNGGNNTYSRRRLHIFCLLSITLKCVIAVVCVTNEREESVVNQHN